MSVSAMARSRWNRVPAPMIIPLDALVRPPTMVSASTSKTVASRDDASSAADKPASPVPTTATSKSLMSYHRTII